MWKQSLFLVFKKFKYGVFYGMCYVYSLIIFKRATGIVCYYGVGCLELFGGSFVVVVMEKLGNTGVLIDYVVRYLETFNYSSRLCSKVAMVETHGSTSSSNISSQNQFSVEVDACFDVKKNTIRLW